MRSREILEVRVSIVTNLSAYFSGFLKMNIVKLKRELLSAGRRSRRRPSVSDGESVSLPIEEVRQAQSDDPPETVSFGFSFSIFLFSFSYERESIL